MLATTAIGLFLGFWSLIYLADYYFRDRSLPNYLAFVESTGLVVSPFQLRLYTGRFQRFLGESKTLKRPGVKRFLDVWFSLGVFAALISLVFMLYLLTSTLWHQFSWVAYAAMANLWTSSTPSSLTPLPTTPTNVDASAGPSIVPVIPGVNLPWSQMPLLFLVLIISGVVHELGHAVAAVNENVTVNGFGVFVLGIYPGAFTELENVGLDAAPVLKKLKIYCAGIWHNLSMAALAVVLLLSMPKLLSPAYIANKGVIVTAVGAESGLTTVGGLRSGDVVYEINYCKVYNEDTWHECLTLMARKNYGYCVPRQQVAQTQATAQTLVEVNGELHCCDANATASHLCFYYKGATSLAAGFNETANSKLSNVFEYSCLPARYVTDHYVCNYSLPCGPQAMCAYPALFNNTKLFRFQLEKISKPVLFIGYPRAIANHVTVSGYVPRFRYAPAWFPPLIDLFLRYLFTFSLALGLLNAVPCYSLDGQFIVGTVADSRCARTTKQREQSRRRRQLFYRCLMLYGTSMLVFVVVVGLLSFAKPIMGEF